MWQKRLSGDEKDSVVPESRISANRHVLMVGHGLRVTKTNHDFGHQRETPTTIQYNTDRFVAVIVFSHPIVVIALSRAVPKCTTHVKVLRS